MQNSFVELKRKDKESEEEYQLRVCGLKDNYDLTWDEVAAMLNEELGNNYTESRYRKQYAAYLKGIRDAQKQTQEDGLDSQELKERYISAAEKLPYFREIKQNARFENFYRLVGEKINTLAVPKFNQILTGPSLNKAYLVTLADLHFGAKFDAVNNSYSVAIAHQRLMILLNHLRDFIKEKQLSEISILSLGDIIQGILRISDLKLNEMAVVESFVIACRSIAEFLNELSSYCFVNFYQVCYSNHDQIRPLGTKASELASEDLGKILLAYLTDVLANNERIRIYGDPDTDYLKFKIFGFNCIALHGHQINNLSTLNKDLSNRHREFFDYVFVGHSHSAKEIINAEGMCHNIETLVAPSFIGSCPYADKLMVGSKAGSKIFEFDEVCGHIASYNIILN